MPVQWAPPAGARMATCTSCTRAQQDVPGPGAAVGLDLHVRAHGARCNGGEFLRCPQTELLPTNHIQAPDADADATWALAMNTTY